jgi:hypothetical protein
MPSALPESAKRSTSSPGASLGATASETCRHRGDSEAGAGERGGRQPPSLRRRDHGVRALLPGSPNELGWDVAGPSFRAAR